MAQRGLKIGKKLEAVEVQFSALPVGSRTEATFKALASARGVSEATYSKRWKIVWALVEAFCKGVVCPHARGAA